jgi:hypothetical protein
MTWKCPDENTFNQIDHLIIDARHLILWMLGPIDGQVLPLIII